MRAISQRASAYGMSQPAPPAGIPAWRSAMAANTWSAVPVAAALSTLNPRLDASINPNYPARPEYMSSDTTSWEGTFSAWNGATFDETNQELGFPLQGGHADYAGNDYWVLRLNRAAPDWVRRSNPSGFDGVVTWDQARLQSGSAGDTVVLAGGAAAPVIYGGTDAASSVNGAYVGHTIEIFGVLPHRTITAYDGATFTATLSSSISGSLPGLTYVVKNGTTIVHGLLGEVTGRYADGRVRSIHSYNKPVFATLDNAYWIPVLGNVSWSGAVGTFDTVRIDRVDGSHGRYGPASSTIAAAPSGGGGCYDPTRGAKGSLWWFGQGGSRLGRFDVDTKVWTQSASIGARGGYMALVYLPSVDLILIASDNSPRWTVYDPVADTYTNLTVTGTAAGGVTDFGHAQPVYCPADGRVYWWNNPSGSTTQINYMAIPANPKTDTWTIQQTTPAGSNAVTPTASLTNGTYGRFAYSQALDGFVLTNSVNGPVYFYARADI